MADQKKIADEIKSNGFAVAKCEMNDESPDEWVMFGVWFFLKQNFFVDLDWRTGKYYFYLESAKEDAKAKEPKNMSLDVYSAESFLSDSLLKHYDTLKEIADAVHFSRLYMAEDESIIDLFEEDDNKAVLYWLVDELGDDTVFCVCNRDIPLIMFSPFADREKLLEEAKRRSFEVVKERPIWASDDDELEEEELEDKVVGFEEINFLF